MGDEDRIEYSKKEEGRGGGRREGEGKREGGGALLVYIKRIRKGK